MMSHVIQPPSHNITQLFGYVQLDRLLDENNYPFILGFFIYEEQSYCTLWRFQQTTIDSKLFWIVAILSLERDHHLVA